MEILVKNATVCDPGSSHNGKKVDLIIRNGEIASIGKNLKSTAKTIIEGKGLHVSPGWFDLHANFTDPGYEHRETIESGAAAAAAGGFTGVALTTATNPPPDSKSGIAYILAKSAGLPCKVYAYGTLSHERAGKDISEMFDMHRHGALAFSDDKRSVLDTGLLMRALQYARGFNGLVMNCGYDKSIAAEGQVHEGVASTNLGLKGIPAIAEDVLVARDLKILEYTGGKLHWSRVSTSGSVSQIKKAKASGLSITCDVAIHNLSFTDGNLPGFDSNYKVNPPLRGKEHRAALIKGIKDGSIDAICSDHSPQDIESKAVEFDHAAYGIAGIETFYGELMTYVGQALEHDEIIRCIAINPRKILGLPVPVIQEGARAELTFFEPESSVEWKHSRIKSGSKNNPMFGSKLTGKVVGTFYNGKLNLNE